MGGFCGFIASGSITARTNGPGPVSPLTLKIGGPTVAEATSKLANGNLIATKTMIMYRFLEGGRQLAV